MFSGSDLNTLLSYIDQLTYAWGGYDDYDVNNLDTSLAIQALKAVNYADVTVISTALAYLTNTQNANGGWGFYHEDDSNVYMTALVLQTFNVLSSTFDVTTQQQKAAAYLTSRQNTDGGFGTNGEGGASTTFETAMAVMALIESGQGQAQPLQNAINWLTSAQLPNGSWNDDPYSTALALRALANVKPNLTLSPSDITFSNPAPTVGDTITITANIKNTGTAQADNLIVQFYSGDPNAGGILIGETPGLSIAAYGSSQTSINWTIPSAGMGAIYVKLDPTNTLDETSEADNLAFRNLTAATLPDLSITPADITFSSAMPMAGDPVTITATIRNLGQATASGVTIDVYDGDPASGGTSLHGTTVASIGGGGSITLQLAGSFASGNHNIYVVVDKTNAISESNKTNNAAMSTLQVRSPAMADLSVTNTDIAFTPLNPTEGDMVTITSSIHNEGEATANSVPVRFYLGDPDTGGIQIGLEAMVASMPARGTAVVTAAWDTTGRAGNNDIYVQIDRLNAIPELTKLNNKAYQPVKVAVRSGPDLVITPADITLTPLSPASGAALTATAVVRNTGTADATNVVVEFSLGNPNVGGTLIMGRTTILSITAGGSASTQLIWSTSGFAGAYDIYANADPDNTIAELSETNNMSYSPVDIQAPQGPDLTITSMDTSALVTDSQTLNVSGAIRIVLANKGNQPVSAPFDLTAFEDSNNNKTLQGGTDNILGAARYTGGLAAGASVTIDIPVSGAVLFRDNIISVVADSGNAIAEQDEKNNTRGTGQACEYQPVVGQFNPVEKWRWTGSAVMPTYKQVVHTPLVARIADTNGDGVIDDKDVPAIIFVTYTDPWYMGNGLLRAVRGDNGQEIFTLTDLKNAVIPESTPAVGDIDNDGFMEIVAAKSTGGTIAFSHDGKVKWTSPYGGNLYTGGVSIADIDGDGRPEIIIGATVLNNDGTLRWQGTGGTGSLDGYAQLSIAVDLDLDGRPEIIAGNTVYGNDGTIKFVLPAPDGFTAVGNFNDDPYPEIVLVTSGISLGYGDKGLVYLFDHAGRLIWGPVFHPGVYRGGPPTIADFDGSGRPGIGVASYYRYAVLKYDGTVLWQAVTKDYSSAVAGSSVFDFDGDGKAEVVYNDESYLRVFRGADGRLLFETPNSTGTAFEYPVIADIDNDNRAEIVVSANATLYYGTENGIRVFKDANNTWVNTRKIWNQHSYHITNVNDDGTIPRYETNNWDTYNSYRCNSMLPEQALATADITASYITADQTNYPSSVKLSARIGNGGAADQIAAVDIAFYDGDPQAGGVLLGTTTTTGTIKPGQYKDASITWSVPSAGSHTIYVVVDKDAKLHECRTDNNRASGLITIGSAQPPTPQQPDLQITQADVTIIPASSIEGQTATVAAIVHNMGTAGASDVAVSFYDGDPTGGGTLIGTVTKARIEAGQTAHAEVAWNTLGQSGRNYIHVVVDPQKLIWESNEANNATLIPVDVTPPALPDLAVTSSDIGFSNLNPAEGESLRITATIRNLGTDTGDVGVTLYDGDPASGGTALATRSITQIIPFGGTAAVSFDIDTLGLAGDHRFYIAADPANAIVESNETNNTAWLGITIGSSDLTQQATTDKASYTANEDTVITVTLINLRAADRQGSLDVKVVDPTGSLVATVAAGQPLALMSGETKTVSFTWNTAKTLSGVYKVYSRYAEADGSASQAEAGMSITAQKTMSAGITTDRISYLANQPVALTATITSNSANYIFNELSAKIAISTQPSAVSIYEETKALQTLMPGQMEELKSYWNTGTYPPGLYPVSLEVKDSSGTVITTSSATIAISGEIKPSKLLKGTIWVDRQHILQGDPVTISYNVTNAGNMDLPSIDLKVLTVHVVNQSVYDTLPDHASLVMGQIHTNSQILQTTTYTAKDYLVILRADIGGTEETLAGTYIRVEGAPSAPSLNIPDSGSDVQTPTPVLTVNNAADPNDDKLTYEFELYSDSGLTNLITSSGTLSEGDLTTAWQVPLTLSENTTYYWRARAYDGLLYGDWMPPARFRVNVENDPPTAPIPASPINNTAVSSLTPVLTVNNASDPDSIILTYNFEVSLDQGFTQPVSSVVGVFEGAGTTSWQVDIPLQENTYYYWRAQADDWLTTGLWSEIASFFVNTTNEAPSAPVITSPSQGSSIASLFTDISVANSIDPDSIGLTYVFELDTASTFDTPALTTSGSIPEGPGSTLWHVTGLQDNTPYYGRAKASDGQAESPWSDTVSFFVNTANDAPTVPVLANPSDGGAVSVTAPVLAVHNATDADGDSLTYDFELYADASMTNLVKGAAGIPAAPLEISWSVSMALTENRTYFWRARAYDGQAYSGWMPLASFFVNTANDAPSAPVLYAPANGSSLQTLTPTLSVTNSVDPDSDVLTYDFEIYSGTTLVKTIAGVAQNTSGITSVTVGLSDNATYTWRARAYDGDRYSGWMDTATFSILMPSTGITVEIEVDPETLNRKSHGNWVSVEIELPSGYHARDVRIDSIRLEGVVPAEPWPYHLGCNHEGDEDDHHDGHGDHDRDGDHNEREFKVKFKRSEVLNVLPDGNRVKMHVTGIVGTTVFEGMDTIRVIK